MAEILPIRPWRYNPSLAGTIDALTSPLFDVVSDKQRAALYQNPLNSLHLSVPEPPDAISRAGTLLDDWKKRGIILQDSLPGIYVYYQYFKLPGSTREYCRKGFIAHIRTYDWNERVILRHENTIPKAVNDRVDLLERTELHVNPTHGLFTDPDFELERYLDAAIQNPIYETEDYQGVSDVMAVIHDARVIKTFIDAMKTKTIILADGHHRYEGSLILKHKRQSSNPDHRGSEGYNYHLMYFTNTEADDLRILPTHRLLTGLKSFDESTFLKNLAAYFTIKPVDDADTLNEIILGRRWTFGLLFKDNAYKITLKPDVLETMSWPFPDIVKKLDLTVMHYFIIEKTLGIPGNRQRQSEAIQFDRSFSDCLQKIVRGDAQLAIITNEVTIEEVKDVCKSGYTMPQKSTYFYPKVIGGFLFSSIKKEEFGSPVYAPF